MNKKFFFKVAILFFGTSLIFSISIRAFYIQEKAKRENLLLIELEKINSSIEYMINSSFLIVYSMATHISIHPDLSEKEYTTLSSELFKKYHNLSNLVAAPDNVIKFVYPIEGNEAILGVDYKSVPEQYKQIEKVLRENKMLLAGPLKLIQGGVGIIARVPVFYADNPDKYWGLVSSVINFDILVELIEKNMNGDYNFIITDNSVKNSPGVIYQTSSIKPKYCSATLIIHLPDREWTTTLYEKNGQIILQYQRIIFFILYLSVLFLGYLIIRSYTKKDNIINYNNSRTKDYAKISANWVWETNSKFKIIYSGGVFNKHNWGEKRNIIGFNISDILIEPDSQNSTESILRLLERESRITDREMWVHIDNEMKCLLVSAIPYYRKNKFAGYRGVGVDITTRRMIEQERVNYLELVDEFIPITQTDLDGNITRCNKAFCNLSGFTESELLGKNHRIMKDPLAPSEIFEEIWKTIKNGKIWEGELRNIRSDGSYYWFAGQISSVHDIFGNNYGYMAVRRDITAEKELLRISITDQLTGVYNRRKLDASIKLSEYNYIRHGIDFSIIIFDIDLFKNFNDKYGHLTGDEVLRVISKTASENIRRSDILGRWGGEEFLIICPGTASEGAAVLAEKIRNFIENIKLNINDNVTCSFGLVSTSDIKEATDLTKYADIALYKAKSAGRNCVKVFKPI